MAQEICTPLVGSLGGDTGQRALCGLMRWDGVHQVRTANGFRPQGDSSTGGESGIQRLDRH